LLGKINYLRRFISNLVGQMESDGNKSLYLVFVGVVFLSILDCF
jgi:hypothetical protein